MLSRERLLDEAWGTGTFVTDRVVDNHIVSLRRKIEGRVTVEFTVQPDGSVPLMTRALGIATVLVVPYGLASFPRWNDASAAAA